MKAVLFALLMLVPGVAWAGCETPSTVGVMPVEICYSGRCERTFIDSYCAAPGAQGIAFANGWIVSWDVDHGKYAGFDGLSRDPSLLSCKAFFDTQENADVISPSCWFLDAVD